MTEKIEVPLPGDVLKKLEFVADYQGKEIESVAELGIRLYLQRFTDLYTDGMEKNDGSSVILHIC